jgi:hypothetical protein
MVLGRWFTMKSVSPHIFQASPSSHRGKTKGRFSGSWSGKVVDMLALMRELRSW